MKKHSLWLTAGAVLVVVFGSLYVVVQQSQRQQANMPQIQMAEDAAAALNRGQQPALVVTGTVDMNRSLAPFVVIYDHSGKPVAGSGYLNGELPAIPKGVLTASDNKAYHTVTWQPQSNVRIASVTVKANGEFYVESGRSLTEVEKNAQRNLLLTLFGLVVSLLVLTAGYVLWQSPKPLRRK